MRKRNKAAGGPNGSGVTFRLPVSNERVFCFLRQHHHQQVLVLLNFTNESQTFYINDQRIAEGMSEIFTQQTLPANRRIELPPFGYQVYEK